MDDHMSAARTPGPSSDGAQRAAASQSGLGPSLVLLFGSRPKASRVWDRTSIYARCSAVLAAGPGAAASSQAFADAPQAAHRV